MIALYKTKCAGPYHIKNDIPCQDDYAYTSSEGGFTIAAVADGLGSSKHSDIASKVAADSAVAVCEGRLGTQMLEEEIIDIMKTAYMVADANIKTIVEKNEGEYDDYDTTLCLAVYDGTTLYYGQAGDSGIIALTKNGEYIPVTSQQRDEEGAVFPLCFGIEYWKFGKVEQISAFALMTDGIIDQIFLPSLEGEEVKLNVRLAERMLEYFEIEEHEISELEEKMAEFWEQCPEEFIDDDKTTICVINTDSIPEKREENDETIDVKV